jgi:serine/threonine protein kinase
MQGRPSNHSGKAGRTATGGVRVGEPIVMRPGASLGRYELVVRLARGATTEIWLAKGRGDKGVAIKALRLDVPQSAEVLRAFAREVTIAGRLQHPNIVEFVEAGRIGPRHYLAMEYVDGMSLAQLGRTTGRRLPPGQLARLVQQACLGLHHAHELSDEDGWLGFLHRDLSPDNLLVSPGGVVKLIDFGAARMRSVADGVGPSALRTRYAAPERVQGLSEDRRSDVYALGVILYEHGTGTAPFQGTDLEVISQIVEGKPRDPRSVMPEFPEELARIVSRAMALQPGDRYPHCQALAAELEAFAVASGATAEGALEAELRGLFDAPPESEPPWEPQPMPVPRPSEEAAPSADARERFAPDADFSNDDITRPSVMMPDEPTAVSPAPPSNGAEKPVWLSERQEALTRAPADVFGAARRSASAVFAAEVPEERPEPRAEPRIEAFPTARASEPSGPDVFSMYGRHAEPAPVPVAPPDRRTSSPAARRFDRGLELLGAKLHELALAEWEEACRLDPGNRLYQTNLKRLRAQVTARAGGQREPE